MTPTSQQQRDANKINAQKSTGPRTPEGKDRSRRNALKHGLLAKSILINEKDPNEDPNDFNDLLNQLRDDLNPKGALEQLLTQRIAVSYWRLRRAYRFEAVSICEHRRDCTQSLTAQLAQGISGITRDPADFVLPSAKDLEKLIRYETLIDRELNRTMLQLQRLQRTRKTSEPPTPNEPKSTPPEAHGLESVGRKRDRSPDQRRQDPRPNVADPPQADPVPNQTNPNRHRLENRGRPVTHLMTRSYDMSRESTHAKLPPPQRQTNPTTRPVSSLAKRTQRLAALRPDAPLPSPAPGRQPHATLVGLRACVAISRTH